MYPFEEMMAMGSLEEERNVDNAREAFHHLKDTYGLYLNREDIDDTLDEYNVDFNSLPGYARKWFNYFELPEED